MLDPACVAPEPRGSARPLDLGKRDILFISIDALRADHVGVYGYKRNTTPHIDALAKKGVIFTHAYCPTPHTSYSVTSMMTGKYMRPLLLQGAGEDSDTWASLLRTYGYRTAAFYPPAVFFIDPNRFTTFKKSHLGFEYAKVEFKEGAGRVVAGDALPRRRERRPATCSSGCTCSLPTSRTRRTRDTISATATSTDTTRRSRSRTIPSASWCRISASAGQAPR